MESDFLQLIETVRAEQADASERMANIFKGDGRSAARNRSRQDGDYLNRLNEAVKIYAGAFESRRGTALFEEALTTSDFSNLFGDIIDRQMLGYYQEAPYTWNNWCKTGSCPDFRTVKRFVVDGSEAVLTAVAEQAEYPESKLVDAKYSYAVSKYGRRLPLSWEVMINDDLDALKDAPSRFGKAARRTEEKFATSLAFDSSGPHASMYTSGNKNIINTTNSGSPYSAVNPALDITALAQGLTTLANMKDTEGEPISIEAVELVVPPALKVTAMNILNATQLLVGAFGQAVTAGQASGGTPNYQMMVNNWLANNIRLSVNSYIPIVATTNGNTSWILVASPSIGRPAYEVGFLRGHESPEIFLKEPNARRIGAGSSDPMNGDFDNDSINYKLRHVLGGTRLDPKATVGSNGSGS